MITRVVYVVIIILCRHRRISLSLRYHLSPFIINKFNNINSHRPLINNHTHIILYSLLSPSSFFNRAICRIVFIGTISLSLSSLSVLLAVALSLIYG